MRTQYTSFAEETQGENRSHHVENGAVGKTNQEKREKV